MKNTTAYMVAVVLLAASSMLTTAQADLILNEDFSSGSTPPDQHRVWDRTINGNPQTLLDTGWNATIGYGTPNIPSAWDIVGGELINPTAVAPTGAGYTESESPVFNWFTNPDTATTNSFIEVSFDYMVGAGDDLHLHFWAVDLGGTAGTAQFLTNNQGWVNGNSGQNQGTTQLGSTAYNLTDGSSPASTGSLSGPLTGMGTYTTTIDLSTLGIPGVSDAGDIDSFFLAFAMNEVGGGATKVDDIHICSVDPNAVPEPSSIALLGLAMVGTLTRRRKR